MKHQTIFQADSHKSDRSPHRRRLDKALPGVMLLALVLVASIWALRHFSAENRMRRATIRIVRLVEKSEDESPVALARVANRLSSQLAATVELDFDGAGILTRGRSETVQLFVQVRSNSESLSLENPQVGAIPVRRGEVRVLVKARYRLTWAGGSGVEGEGTADLLWRKTDDGWRIVQVRIRDENRSRVPGGGS